MLANASKAGSDVREVYLHVWVANEEAVSFYRRFGFEVGERLPGYYRRIDPPDALVLRLAVKEGAAGGAAAAAAAPAAAAATAAAAGGGR